MARDSREVRASSVKRRQFHLWLSDADYEFLDQLANSRDESMSSIVRRIVRSLRTRESGALKKSASLDRPERT